MGFSAGICCALHLITCRIYRTFVWQWPVRDSGSLMRNNVTFLEGGERDDYALKKVDLDVSACDR